MSIQSYIYQDPQEASAAIAISGGSTPKLLFSALAKSKFDWSRVYPFWVDEHGVPPTELDPQTAAHVEQFHRWRITLLPGVLEAARNTILGAGGDNAEPRRTVLHEPYDPMKHPVQIAWFLDQPPARLLN